MIPAILTVAGVGLLGLAGAAAFAARKFRLKCKIERQSFDRVKVIDGGADLTAWSEEAPRLSVYICYVRRMREKTQQAQEAQAI